VLVVEDEEVIRTLATEFMADIGFEVLEAPDADTAVRLLQTEAKRVHVLFTDLRMPGAMNGLMLAHHTRRKLALDRLGNNIGLLRRGASTIAGRYAVLPKTL
jgi:CheY-like chemotaxis protein